MSEIKTSDLAEVKSPEKQGFQEIQPQEGMKPQEANAFWDNEVSNLEHQDTSSDVYKDDNGKGYRIGDNLIPDNKFEVDGFTFETDSNGRTKTAEGQLHIAPPSKRNLDKMDVVAKGDNIEGDQRGHLIARRFGGSDKLENLVPMDGELNQGEYAKMENELADAVKDGAEVQMKVEPQYEGDSNRPTEIRVTYTIDGDTSVKVFRNGGDN